MAVHQELAGRDSRPCVQERKKEIDLGRVRRSSRFFRRSELSFMADVDIRACGVPEFLGVPLGQGRRGLVTGWVPG